MDLYNKREALDVLAQIQLKKNGEGGTKEGVTWPLTVDAWGVLVGQHGPMIRRGVVKPAKTLYSVH